MPTYHDNAGSPGARLTVTLQEGRADCGTLTVADLELITTALCTEIQISRRLALEAQMSHQPDVRDDYREKAAEVGALLTRLGMLRDFLRDHSSVKHWPDATVRAEIESLQAIQKRNPPSGAAWKRASEALAPLLAEMARRADAGARHPSRGTVADAEDAREFYADSDEPGDACTNPGGHKWVYTGTAYGGDDERWHGEGRCYCEHCGADGDA